MLIHHWPGQEGWRYGRAEGGGDDKRQGGGGGTKCKGVACKRYFEKGALE